MAVARSTLALACFLVLAAVGTAMSGCADTSVVTQDASVVTLKDSDLPWQKLYNVSKGDSLNLTLPDGQQIRWLVQSDSLFGASEQTTACGLRFDVKEPAFALLKRYGVSTSTGQSVSIYSFDLGDYHVDRAVDLRCDYALIMAIRVEKADARKGIEHAEARALFNKETRPGSAKQLRVPIATVHHGLNEKFAVPVRLVLTNTNICFQVSGNAHEKTEQERVQLLTSMMDYVVERYEGIDRTDKLSFDVLSQDDIVLQYKARRDDSGAWKLHKMNDGSV